MNKKSGKSYFLEEEEEKIIDFVRRNEILFNVRHKHFRNFEEKNRLWCILAHDLNKEVEIVKKKWITMRDYFKRSQKKKITGSEAATTIKRDESLTFLLNTSTVKRPTLTNLTSDSQTDSWSKDAFNFMTPTSATPTPCLASASTTPTARLAVDVDEADDSVPEVVEIKFNENSQLGSDIESVDLDTYRSHGSELEIPRARKPIKQSAPNDTEDVLKEFLDRKRPDPITFFPPLPARDSLDAFFYSIAATMRTFSPVAIAKIKFEISKIVSAEEISVAEKNAAAAQVELVLTPNDDSNKQTQQTK